MTAPLYRFAVISDVHIDLEDGGKKTYFTYAEDNFLHALRTIKNLGCRFIVSAGDQITNASGGTAEWRRYRELIAQSGYDGLILEALGNHETRCAKYGCTLSHSLGEFLAYAGLEHKPVNLPSGKTYYEYLDPTCGDSFIFMALENGADANLLDNFSAEQMDWVERLVEKRTKESRRIFLIQHAPIYAYGAGDRTDSPAYAGSIRMQDECGKPFPGNRRFKALIESRKNIIWLSGHTHVDFADNVNFANEACRMLHVPALAGTTRIIADKSGGFTLDRTFRPHCAQGYHVEVYDDKTIFQGYDFYSGDPIEKILFTIPRNST